MKKRMLQEALIVFAGFLIVLGLADVIVRSVLLLSKHFGLSGTFVGLTVLSIGTSIPEIMSAIIGSINILSNPTSAEAFSGLIIGQNVGSDIFQQSFVLALVGILGTIIVVKKDLVKEVGALIAGAVLVWIFALGGMINRFEGFILFFAYVAYLFYLNRNRQHKKVRAEHHLTRGQIALQTTIIVVCFGVMGFVADKVLEMSTILISSLSISASFFGVILLGVASALPELTTALVGIYKKQGGISTGVLIGSNITNPLVGLGIGTMIAPYFVPDVVLKYDLPFKIGTALLILFFLHKHKDLKKWQGVVLICLFLAYLLIRQMYFPSDF